MAATTNQAPGGFTPLKPGDFPPQDNTLFALNNLFITIYTQLQALQLGLSSLNSSSVSGSSSSSSWVDYTPTPVVNGLGMTISSPVIFWSKTLTTSGQVFINLDLQCSIGGSLGPALMVNLPGITPASNSYGNVFSCVLYPGSSTPVAGIARLATVGSTAGIYVYRADGANFTAASTEIVISGWYQI